MAEFQRYVARTEAWARPVEDDTEDLVGTTGRVTAYRGDIVVFQRLRGETFVYVMTADEFAEDWVLPTEKSTDTATSETGTDPLPHAERDREAEESTTGENVVDNPPAAVATGGQRAEPTPAESTDTETREAVPQSPETAPEGGTADEAPPTPTASAPTSAGPGDTAQATSAGNPPNVGADTTDAVSPVSGTMTPVEPAPAPPGSAAGETSVAESPGTTLEGEPAQPAPTTPTQTLAPSQESAPVGETTGAESTTRVEGGDAGTAPTPNVEADEADASTGNVGGEPVTSEPAPETPPDVPAANTDTVTPEAEPMPPAGDTLETEGKPTPAKRSLPKDNPQA